MKYEGCWVFCIAVRASLILRRCAKTRSARLDALSASPIRVFRAFRSSSEDLKTTAARTGSPPSACRVRGLSYCGPGSLILRRCAKTRSARLDALSASPIRVFCAFRSSSEDLRTTAARTASPPSACRVRGPVYSGPGSLILRRCAKTRSARLDALSASPIRVFRAFRSSSEGLRNTAARPASTPAPPTKNPVNPGKSC
jgi:hypothetical protein